VPWWSQDGNLPIPFFSFSSNILIFLIVADKRETTHTSKFDQTNASHISVFVSIQVQCMISAFCENLSKMW
jgi:hypothetical protein